jgi:hypothetical protein
MNMQVATQLPFDRSKLRWMISIHISLNLQVPLMQVPELSLGLLK